MLPLLLNLDDRTVVNSFDVYRSTDRVDQSDDALKTPEERRLKQQKLAMEKSKRKMGMLDSFRFLSKSKYLGYIGLIVVSYGLSMEFTEIVWKVIAFFGLLFWSVDSFLFLCFVVS